MTYCHLAKFSTWQIAMWKKLSTWEMWRKSVMWKNDVYNLWCFVALNWDFFVAIYALLCGENVNQQLRMWRKYDKYEVCPQTSIRQHRRPQDANRRQNAKIDTKRHQQAPTNILKQYLGVSGFYRWCLLTCFHSVLCCLYTYMCLYSVLGVS